MYRTHGIARLTRSSVPDRRRPYRGLALRCAAAMIAGGLVAGCASHDRVDPASGGEAPPLEVRLEAPSYGTFTAHLNTRSYVTLFEVIPGRGVGLLYPTASWQERPLAAGVARMKVLRPGIRPYREAYRLDSPGPMNQPTPDAFKAQRMVFLVASAVAPQLGTAEDSRPGITRLLRDETAEQPYEAMERIIAVILPGVARARVATDVWVEAPAVARK